MSPVSDILAYDVSKVNWVTSNEQASLPGGLSVLGKDIAAVLEVCQMSSRPIQS